MNITPISTVLFSALKYEWKVLPIDNTNTHSATFLDRDSDGTNSDKKSVAIGLSIGNRHRQIFAAAQQTARLGLIISLPHHRHG